MRRLSVSAALQPPLDDSRLRTLQLGTRLLSYRLKRSSRRSIGFVISRSGLTITAPMRLSLTAIEAAIVEKQRWIFTKLIEWADRPAPFAETPPDWQDGATLPILGEVYTLRLIRHDLPVTGRTTARIHSDVETHTLTLPIPHTATSLQIAALLKRWLQQQAKQRFAERLEHYAPVVRVRYHAFALSSATTRWGSCSSAGNIRLNWRLIHFPLDVIDYVVVHELAHLREMNHSPRFWAIVETVMPDYKPLRAVLKHPQAGAIPAL